MASKSALLRNIRPSGGLFTENILLRLRDNPNQLKIGKIDSFLEEDTKEERKKLTEKKQIIFDWCIQKWDEISPNIEEWPIEELAKKWLIPLFTLFDHEIEDFEINKENLDEDSVLKEFRISYQSRDHRNPFFHYVSVNEDFNAKIDRNPQKKSHHNVCQQFINFNPEIKWLFLSNGRILRILTKYYHSYSKGYLEFDLENIFANRDEREFDTLYSIIHMSRFIPDYEDHKFLIDIFQRDSITEGVKIGDTLRDNVEHALELLGNELIQQNLDKIDLDKIDVKEFYAELLRIIYRIIFILYAEQRDMLPGASSLYFEQFSLSSLRIRAEKPIKAEKNYDLWNKMLITFNLVRDGNSLLGVNSYNGNLFKEDNLRIILENGMKISNDIVLKVIRLLTTSANHKVRQRINFLEVTEEEIGAIYESLLDFKPDISSTSQFQLIEGTERKSTGSYYTPKALIDILIRTTLQPLVEDRLIKAGDDEHARESAILDLKVCDPACGGGTFLLSALDYLGKKLAEVRTRSDSPLEDDLREARREILQHCIYGVDMNPLAVELAKISLWLRACVKDKPLNFLDNHIKCGNSLVGLGQKTELEYIDPEAFFAVSGNKATDIPTENKKLQNMARERIRNQIKIQKKAKQELEKQKIVRITSFLVEKTTSDICSSAFQEVIELPEDKPEQIEIKEKKYKSLKRNPNYQLALAEADIWTSAYFWPFEGNALGNLPDNALIEQLRDNIYNEEIKNLLEKIKNIAKDNQFFHWYIEFPEVFSTERGGFDCILSNPPWTKLLLKERDFFIGRNAQIGKTKKQSERRNLIKSLKVRDKKLFNLYCDKWKNFKKTNNFLKNSKLFKLSAQGTLNTYPLFAERCWTLISPQGFLGLIVPAGIFLNYYMQDLFRGFISNNAIKSLFSFINKKKLFDIGVNEKFCLLSLTGSTVSKKFIPMSFDSIDPEEIQKPLEIVREIKDFSSITDLTDENSNLIIFEEGDFKLFNPNSLTCPMFTKKKDFLITKKIYSKNRILYNEQNPIIPSLEIHRMFHGSDDSKLFHSIQDIKLAKKMNHFEIYDLNGNIFLPLYDGKLIWQYDHRHFSFEDFSSEILLQKKKNINYCIQPEYWIEKRFFEKKVKKWNWDKGWFLAIRKIARSTDKRVAISTIIPNYPSVYSLKLFLNISAEEALYLLSIMNTFIFDYCARQKIDRNMAEYIIKQLPVPDFKLWKKYTSLIIPRCIQLIYSNIELRDFALDCGFKKFPFEWNPKNRHKIMAELEAIISILYGITKEELEYILDQFKLLTTDDPNEYNTLDRKFDILNYFDHFKKLMNDLNSNM